MFTGVFFVFFCVWQSNKNKKINKIRIFARVFFIFLCGNPIQSNPSKSPQTCLIYALKFLCWPYWEAFCGRMDISD